jgi:hypothetical protein
MLPAEFFDLVVPVKYGMSRDEWWRIEGKLPCRARMDKHMIMKLAIPNAQKPTFLDLGARTCFRCSTLVDCRLRSIDRLQVMYQKVVLCVLEA